MMKTFRIGDLVCYEDDFVNEFEFVDDSYLEDNGRFVGTIIGWSKSFDGRTCAKIHWFDWFKAGPTQTVEYFREIQLISGER